MTVRQIDLVRQESRGAWIGLSTDTKPTTGNGVNTGSTFYETDTGATYIFNGAAWGPWEAGDSIVSGALTDRSGTITAGGAAQTLAAANPARRYLLIQNASAADLWINFTTAAVIDSPSIKLSAGDAFSMAAEYVSNQLISIIGATTGQKFTAKEG